MIAKRDIDPCNEKLIYLSAMIHQLVPQPNIYQRQIGNQKVGNKDLLCVMVLPRGLSLVHFIVVEYTHPSAVNVGHCWNQQDVANGGCIVLR